MSSTTDKTFLPISDGRDLVEQEEDILAYWDKIDAFKTSLKKSEGKPRYTFYDGPPFATGLPHYGHILAGTIKDIVTRYAHQTGHHVERRFGWDTHGLPIEFEIEKQLGIKTKEDVLKLGIDKYNEACRGIVMRYSSEWEKSVTRLGRWIDFKNDYKTMQPEFMESVWWVFSQLWEKDLVYRGFKVMPYSTACTTPLSNFESGMNYQEVSDPELIAEFPKVDDPEVSFLAWTTTPWTLPSNVALCVHPDFDYVEILDKPSGKKYIVAKSRLSYLYKKKQRNNYEILKTMKGVELKGQEYKPLFDYFTNFKKTGAFKIVTDDYVTDDSGTGVVHNAPGFGEDDYRVCMDAGIISKGSDIPCPVDESGRFTDPVSDFKGKYIKDADKDVIAALKKRGLIYKQGSVKHRYPFCWRSDTPLIYRAIPSWFVRVEKVKEQLLKNNKETYWVPDFVKEKRFHNWLENANDWAVSRSRYWGTPIPVWTNESYSEFVVIDSIEKLEKLTGKTVTDLHRENIDDLEIPAPSGNGVLKRIPDVFDCWFESGSMPYAQCHYPFENKENFLKERFPADFIAEGLDQTRGWFYTLMVLGTALFDRPPFKNLIVNGIVLAADGRKMSKRLKNYPAPSLIVDKFGADALRLYLIDSPVVRAEPLKFQEDGVENVRNSVFRPWFNAYRFYVQTANSFFKKNPSLSFNSTEAASHRPENVMDKWILSLNQSLVKFVREEMKGYRLYTVIPKLVDFIEQLTNWYVRMNRPRMKGDQGAEDQRSALMALYTVLFTVCRLMAPFTPFLTEAMYQNLKRVIPEEEREDSVHYLMVPDFDASFVDEDIERSMSRVQEVVIAARDLRNKSNITMKIPVRSVSVCTTNEQYLNDITLAEEYIKFELHCKELHYVNEVKDFLKLSAHPKNRELGRRLKKKLRPVAKEIESMDHDQVSDFMEKGEITVLDENISIDEVIIKRTFIGDEKKYSSAEVGANLVIMDHILDDELRQDGALRDLSSAVMQLRKEARLVPEDPVDVYFEFSGDTLKKVCENKRDILEKNLPNMKLIFTQEIEEDVRTFISKTHEIPEICGEYASLNIAFGGSIDLQFKSYSKQTEHYKKHAAAFQESAAEAKKRARAEKERANKAEASVQDLQKQVEQLAAEKEKLIKKLKDQAPAQSSGDVEKLKNFASNIESALKKVDKA